MSKGKSKGIVGLIVRVSDVSGRDKRGDRFISPVEQISLTLLRCPRPGYKSTDALG
jgi:hypothetical protein